MAQRMIVVGGPPGSGKSTALPVRSFGVDAFNVDDRCHELHGSYERIPREIARLRVPSARTTGVRAHIESGLRFRGGDDDANVDSHRAGARSSGEGLHDDVVLPCCGRRANIHVERVPGPRLRWRARATGRRDPSDLRRERTPSCRRPSLPSTSWSVSTPRCTTARRAGSRAVAPGRLCYAASRSLGGSNSHFIGPRHEQASAPLSATSVRRPGPKCSPERPTKWRFRSGGRIQRRPALNAGWFTQSQRQVAPSPSWAGAVPPPMGRRREYRRRMVWAVGRRGDGLRDGRRPVWGARGRTRP